MEKHKDIQKVPFWAVCTRTVLEFLLRTFFPRIIHKSRAFTQARLDAQKGKGLVMVFTHFSLRDAMEVNRSMIYLDPVLKSREVINPLAYHMNNTFMILVGKLFQANFAPIVNNSTLARKKYSHLAKGKGLKEFIENSAKVLAHGGIVTLAVNATRSERLDIEGPQKPAGFLIASLQAKGVNNYGILLVSFAIKNATTYDLKVSGGMNVGKTYLIKPANYYSLDELLNNPAVNGNVSNVDKFIRTELAKVSPKEYL